ncbi:TolC family protein [Lichenicoccus sp.]|uniref:TolC family protein n=1 Tax=Lichenicoccus sp. TaxID=2781899 RepID=UPI003D138E23
MPAMSIWGRRGHRCPATVAAVLLVAPCVAPCTARSQPIADESLHQAVAQAWARLPQRADFQAQENVAAANHLSGSTFFPNAPYLTGQYDDDRFGSNYDYKTTQAELGTPLWLPGEGTATQRAANAEAASIGAARQAAHLALAADVLALTTNARIALQARDVASQRVSTYTALSRSAAQRYQVGEGSQSDSLAADAEAASASASLEEAQASLGAAIVALAQVTGHEAIPTLDAPPPTGQVSLAHDPRIMAAERAVAAAAAAARLVRIQDRDDPELGLQVTNDKQPGSPWDTRVGVVFRLGFASEARNAPRRARAEAAVTRATVRLLLVRRAVTAAVQAAALEAGAADRATRAAERAASALARRRAQVETAWRLGETPLIELVRADAAASDAALARDRAQIRGRAARLRLALAEGTLP